MSPAGAEAAAGTEAAAGADSLRLEIFTRRAMPGREGGQGSRVTPRGSLSPSCAAAGSSIFSCSTGIPSLTAQIAAEVFCDAVAQEMLWDAPAADRAFRGEWDILVEVTDPARRDGPGGAHGARCSRGVSPRRRAPGRPHSDGGAVPGGDQPRCV